MKFADLWHPPRQDGWQNTGVIVTRAYHGDFPAEDYQRILAGPRRTPDSYTAYGAPVYLLPEWEQAAVQRELDHYCFDRQETHNVACNVGKVVVLNFIGSNGSPTGVNYFAVGTGTSVSPSSNDTQLVSEFYRQSPTAVSVTGTSVLIATNFSTGVANTTYTEAGLFGNGATGTANSGTLFAHAVYSYTKDSSITLTNDYTITLS